MRHLREQLSNCAQADLRLIHMPLEVIVFDEAGHLMAGGSEIAIARVHGVNDNMRRSHYHTYFELYYLEAGSRWVVAGDNLYQVHAGEVIVFPPFMMHYSYGDTDVRFKRIVVYFDSETVLVHEVLQRLGDQVNSYRLSGHARANVDLMLTELTHVQDVHDEFYTEQMRLLLTELLITVIRQPPSDALVERTDRMTQVIRYLHEHHSDPLTLDEIAAQFHISRYYLCHEFKKLTQSTIVQYLNNVRIGQAQRLLNETDLTITQISKQVGFANVTHFNRVFRQVTAMSPSASRKPALHR